MSERTETPKLSGQFSKALVYAERKHHNQVRKGGDIPYAGHLLSVASLVINDGGTEEQAIAALLLDAVEDAGGPATLEEIRANFGEDVARIFEQCSDTDEVPKPPWLERKRRYIDLLADVGRDTLLVSVADKLDRYVPPFVRQITAESIVAGTPGEVIAHRRLSVGNDQRKGDVRLQHRIVRSSQPFAPAPQCRESALYTFAAPDSARPVVLAEIRGVGMLGHLSQRDPLAASGDEDRDPRALDRPRFQRRRAHAEVSAGRRRRGITPEPAQGPDRLIHHLLALADTAQRDPHLLEFVFVIAHAQPDHQAAIAQRIDVGG